MESYNDLGKSFPNSFNVPIERKSIVATAYTIITILVTGNSNVCSVTLKLVRIIIVL